MAVRHHPNVLTSKPGKIKETLQVLVEAMGTQAAVVAATKDSPLLLVSTDTVRAALAALTEEVGATPIPNLSSPSPRSYCAGNGKHRS